MRISDWSSDVCSSDLEHAHEDGWRSGCQGRGATRSAAKRTWGEPIFEENWGAPTGLESRFASRHAGHVETSPSNARDHGTTVRTANSRPGPSSGLDGGWSPARSRATPNNYDYTAGFEARNPAFNGPPPAPPKATAPPGEHQ